MLVPSPCFEFGDERMTAGSKGPPCPPLGTPLAVPQLAPLRLLRARLAALGSTGQLSGSAALAGREAGPLGAQPPPRVLEQAATEAADLTSPHLTAPLAARGASASSEVPLRR
jgi:hypothetical protein